MNTKNVSEIMSKIVNPDSQPEPQGKKELEALKTEVDKVVEGWDKEYGIEHFHTRLRIMQIAKNRLGISGTPSQEEIDFCFPDYDNPKPPMQAEQPSQPKRSTKQRPTRAEAKERLNEPVDQPEQTAEVQSDSIELSKADWKRIEMKNHPLGGRLDYGAGFTPEFLELDIKHNISNHRTRLYAFLSLHCDTKTGISSKFSVEELAEKLKCGKPEIRRAIKELDNFEVAKPSEYPQHYTKPITFTLPFTKKRHRLSYLAQRIANRVGVDWGTLWEKRDKFGFPVKIGGEAEGEGVRPPSSS